ncbi:MAG: Gfo/Idh/MocA family oxidoreductase [Oscillospiraceae bacterium]|jgi:predicted dehydrogenase|nr:Gfo/Idh/MocA family oxidoreductase [Oscillospiraceae bacterium]
MDKVKAVMVGCGGIAFGKHLPKAEESKLVDFVGFCDIVPERAEKARAQYGAEGAVTAGSLTQLLTHKDIGKSIEAVYVCTPNRSHSALTVEALEAGCHVLCEKPMAINAAEAKKMLEAAEKSGKLLSVGYQNRYRREYMFAKDMAQSGELGDIYFARAKAVRRRAVPTWGVFLNEREQGGGPLIDIGTHALDLVLWVMDNYKPKYAVGTAYHKLNGQTFTGNAWGDWDTVKFTAEDSAFGFIVMENGATVTLEASWALNDRFPQEAVFTMSGTKAGIDFTGGVFVNDIRAGRQAVTEVAVSGRGVDFYEGDTGASPDLAEQKTFLRAVRGEGELVVKPEQAYAVTLILDAIYKSAAEGKPVFFDQ